MNKSKKILQATNLGQSEDVLCIFVPKQKTPCTYAPAIQRSLFALSKNSIRIFIVIGFMFHTPRSLFSHFFIAFLFASFPLGFELEGEVEMVLFIINISEMKSSCDYTCHLKRLGRGLQHLEHDILMIVEKNE